MKKVYRMMMIQNYDDAEELSNETDCDSGSSFG